MAVEVHQYDASSSDMRFDLSLVTAQPEPPWQMGAVLSPGSDLVLSWPSAMNRRYAVDLTTNLLGGFPLCEQTNITASPPLNRNVCIFPEKINGWYVALHRPMHNMPLGLNSVWLAQSRDLAYWGNFRRLFAPRPDAWDSHHIGGGAPPIATDKGWLVVYHGSDKDNRYCLGAALLDRENPDRVLCRHPQALLLPEMEYEQKGFFGNVVFTDGAVVQDGLLRVYYGASDQVTCLADYDLEQVLAALT